MAEILDSLTLDAANGCILTDVPDEALDRGHARLQALDVIRAPNLTCLVVSHQDPDEFLHLRVDDAPALREIHLPRDGLGAVIHIAAKGSLDALVIHGPVADIDAASADGSFVMSMSDGHRWPLVRFESVDAVPGLPDADPLIGQGLVVVSGDAAAQSLALVAARDWVVMGTPSVSAIRHDGPGRLRVKNAQSLQSIESLGDRARLKVSDVPQLTQVTGRGKRLSLSDARSGITDLRVDGPWDAVTLRCPRLQSLTIPDAAELRLIHCHRLVSLKASEHIWPTSLGDAPALRSRAPGPMIDESTVREYVARVRDGDEGELDALFCTMGTVQRRVDVLNSLRLLSALADRGFDPTRLWQARQRLSASQMRRRRHETGATPQQVKGAAQHWEWHLPIGLELEGWGGDLKVWSWCQRHVREASDYRRTLIKRSDDPSALNALIHVGSRAASDSPLRALMIEVLIHWTRVRRRSRFYMNNVRYRQPTSLIETLSAPSLFARVDDPARAALLDYLVIHYRDATLHRVLGALLAHHPALVRPRLMMLANPAGTWLEGHRPRNTDFDHDPDSCGRFMQLALMPIQPATAREA